MFQKKIKERRGNPILKTLFRQTGIARKSQIWINLHESKTGKCLAEQKSFTGEGKQVDLRRSGISKKSEEAIVEGF